MDHNQKREDNHLSSQDITEIPTDAQLPEWHPFAVWQTQIRNEQTSKTRTHPVLRSVTP